MAMRSLCSLRCSSREADSVARADLTKRDIDHSGRQKPKDLDHAEELWTTRLLAQHVRSHSAAAGHPSLQQLGRGTVSKLLAAQAMKPHKIWYYLERRDPDFESKMANHLCVHKQVEVLRAAAAVPVGDGPPAPGFVAVLSYDEKPGIQVLQTTSPDRPPVPGKHATFQRDHEYIRRGTLSHLCGIDLLTGKILGRIELRHRSREFITRLKDADAAYPADWKIRLVLDNHSAHTSKETRAYLETVPNRFEFFFTPKHGSWLNLVEMFFSKLARTLLRGIRADSPEELRARASPGTSTGSIRTRSSSPGSTAGRTSCSPIVMLLRNRPSSGSADWHRSRVVMIASQNAHGVQ